MSADANFYHKVRNFPQRVENARRRLKELERDAAKMGARDIKTQLSVINAAWDREIEHAKIEASERGQECSMGVDHAS